MTVVEHRPPEFIDIADDVPSIFLAGPIQGAPDWQSLAVYNLASYGSDHSFMVSNPRVYSDFHHDYLTQVNWEKRYLERARDFGALLFWFAAKDNKEPYEEGRAYAQTSRIELGRAFGWRDYNPDIKLVLGIEPAYTGNERYFRTLADEFDDTVCTDLGSLCIAAVRAIR